MLGSRLGPAGFCLKALWWVILQGVLGVDLASPRWSLREKMPVYSVTGPGTADAITSWGREVMY